ncbi:hypothetical protein C1H70_01045 [Halomonas urumqiensis]|uniref:Uncharacterized protein n=1 Tax=Halomonas urumqiensis TaxID=1684789 RepID=A0A2N7UR07_9GAMM|nr:hypothetical protein C1H70_01045 [Halomonas urumqiensis]PTB01805.1 hypothetical protein C6V82_12155 [Halomonas urumqiensis]GHE21901.1 hypothetical protein GCM10017767_24220 [Halomonas urumqiensis]
MLCHLLEWLSSSFSTKVRSPDGDFNPALAVFLEGYAGACNPAILPHYVREALNKSTSEMKRKAHGAQEPEHMGYM